MAKGKHPAPFRTWKLSPSAPMVLHAGACGRVGRRRTSFQYGPPPGGPYCVGGALRRWCPTWVGGRRCGERARSRRQQRQEGGWPTGRSRRPWQACAGDAIRGARREASPLAVTVGRPLAVNRGSPPVAHRASRDGQAGAPSEHRGAMAPRRAASDGSHRGPAQVRRSADPRGHHRQGARPFVTNQLKSLPEKLARPGGPTSGGGIAAARLRPASGLRAHGGRAGAGGAGGRRTRGQR